LQQEEPGDQWRNHLVLTLDKRYQEIVEQVMDKAIVRGAVVVLDVATGDVLAQASRPDFDQNQVSKYLDGVDELIDRTQRVAFYPGSVFKMVVAIGVLEEGLLKPDEVFNCNGAYVFSDNTQIKCLLT
jgi:penicillin-binding protein 2